MSQFTAQAQMQGLKERLNLVMKGHALSDSFDANGYPILRVLDASENQFIAIIPIAASGFVDGFGLTQRHYSPSMAVLVREATATTVNVEGTVQVMAQCAKLGMKLEIWEGTGVKVITDYATALAAATLIVTLPANENGFGMTLSQ